MRKQCRRCGSKRFIRDQDGFYVCEHGHQAEVKKYEWIMIIDSLECIRQWKNKVMKIHFKALKEDLQDQAVQVQDVNVVK